jgi:hypothetical protein
VYFTNYGRLNRISRAAGNVFSSNPEAFIDAPLVQSSHEVVERVSRRVRYEMSPKDVYGALSEDFDL